MCNGCSCNGCSCNDGENVNIVQVVVLSRYMELTSQKKDHEITTKTRRTEPDIFDPFGLKKQTKKNRLLNNIQKNPTTNRFKDKNMVKREKLKQISDKNHWRSPSSNKCCFVVKTLCETSLLALAKSSEADPVTSSAAADCSFQNKGLHFCRSTEGSSC